ncbi:MAG: hypothetical protein V4677_15765 [Bacteroidota bacterium]
MTATTEISVEEVVKTIINSPEDESNFKIKQDYDNLQLIIVEHFNKHESNSLRESFVDLYEIILNFKINALPFIKKDTEYRAMISDENNINNDIISIYQNDFIQSPNLNLSIIKSLELFRDNKHISIDNVPDNINELGSILLPSSEANIAKIISQEFNNLQDDNLNEELKKLKKLYFSALSIDFSFILYLLIEDQKLNFSPEKLKDLTEFNTSAHNDYNSIAINFNLYAKVTTVIMDIAKFLTDRTSNTDILTEVADAIYKVFELKDLEHGWDDEESVPIKIEHIEKGVDVIASLFKEYNKIPTFIAPTVCSGVLLEYAGDNDRLDVRIGDENDILMTHFKNRKIEAKRIVLNNDYLDTIWKSQRMR